ncbi:hypothetical protein GCM10011507_24120 [Edaphobacter acidisoli]|uniref:Uncharacterized protein n=1 Tax=Edaphobacter acidisoli TaxID=2040573 RepID=A0A916RUY7_9BACT|nr:hypothetical protein GCM10011507_24120 [Edaphobacter acidisoli]
MVAVRKRVESGSQQNILLNTIGNRAGKIVLRIAAARHHERTQSHRPGAIRTLRRATNFFGVSIAENGHGNGIFKNERLRVVELMRGAAHGDAKCSAGWRGVLHR